MRARDKTGVQRKEKRHLITQSHTILVVKTMKGIREPTLVHSDHDEVIVNHRDAKTLTIYDKNFEKLRSMELKYEIFDMALTSSANVIATDDNEVDRVIRITPSGDVSTVCIITPLGDLSLYIYNGIIFPSLNPAKRTPNIGP